MKVTQVTYAMLRKLSDDFENDRVEVVIELEENDDVDRASARAQRLCKEALYGKELDNEDNPNFRPIELT